MCGSRLDICDVLGDRPPTPTPTPTPPNRSSPLPLRFFKPRELGLLFWGLKEMDRRVFASLSAASPGDRAVSEDGERTPRVRPRAARRPRAPRPGRSSSGERERDRDLWRRAWERVKAAEATEGEVAPPPPSAPPWASGWSAAPTGWAARCFHLLKKFMARAASPWCMSELMEDEDDGAPMEAEAEAEDTDAEDEVEAEAEAEAENPKAPAPDA